MNHGTYCIFGNRITWMELEQTQLVNAMHSARLQNFEAGKLASTHALTHANTLQAFAEQIVQYPEIQAILETNQKIKSPHLADRGGWIKIRERMQQGEWPEEDIHVLATQLRNKAASQSLTHVREQSQSSRRR